MIRAIRDAGGGFETETIKREHRKQATPEDTDVLGHFSSINRSRAPFYALVLGLDAKAYCPRSCLFIRSRSSTFCCVAWICGTSTAMLSPSLFAIASRILTIPEAASESASSKRR